MRAYVMTTGIIFGLLTVAHKPGASFAPRLRCRDIGMHCHIEARVRISLGRCQEFEE